MRSVAGEVGIADGRILVSVVIPTYNNGHDLERAVRSVLGQMSERVELLVIDDGSTDGTSERLVGIDPGPHSAAWLRQPNRGPAAARNSGLKCCRGTWVLFLDADDTLEPGALADILRIFDERPDVDLLLGDHLVVHPNGVERLMPAGSLPTDPNRRLADYLLLKRINICHGAAVFRRSRVLERPYPERFEVGEDIPVFAFMLCSPSVVSVPRVFARIHRQVESRRTRLVDRQHQAFVAETFDCLPDPSKRLRARFQAQRLLSEFRSCYRAGDLDNARKLYSGAFALSPVQAMRWTYLSKRLRLIYRFAGAPAGRKEVP